jgi:hypothetical protein
MPVYKYLKVPVFDLVWGTFYGESYALMPGGGGSLKSGVKNQILIGGGLTKKDIVFHNSLETDTDARSMLCSSVSIGNIDVLFSTTFFHFSRFFSLPLL